MTAAQMEDNDLPIVRQTDTELVIEARQPSQDDSRQQILWGIGVLAISIIFLLILALVGTGIVAALVIVPCYFLAIGIAAIGRGLSMRRVSVEAITWIFNKTQGTFTIAERRRDTSLGEPIVTEYIVEAHPLPTAADVEIQSSSMAGLFDPHQYTVTIQVPPRQVHVFLRATEDRARVQEVAECIKAFLSDTSQ